MSFRDKRLDHLEARAIPSSKSKKTEGLSSGGITQSLWKATKKACVNAFAVATLTAVAACTITPEIRADFNAAVGLDTNESALETSIRPIARPPSLGK